MYSFLELNIGQYIIEKIEEKDASISAEKKNTCAL